jgi:hypothetical protein
MDKSKFNNPQEWKKFAIELAVILTVIAVVQWYLDAGLYRYFLAAAGVILLAGLVWPAAMKPLFILFSYIAFVLGWTMTRIILFLLFYLVFTPIGLVLKLSGKRLLDTSFNTEQDSYWIEREKGQEVDYTKQF